MEKMQGLGRDMAEETDTDERSDRLGQFKSESSCRVPTTVGSNSVLRTSLRSGRSLPTTTRTPTSSPIYIPYRREQLPTERQFTH